MCYGGLVPRVSFAVLMRVLVKSRHRAAVDWAPLKYWTLFSVEHGAAAESRWHWLYFQHLCVCKKKQQHKEWTPCLSNCLSVTTQINIWNRVTMIHRSEDLILLYWTKEYRTVLSKRHLIWFFCLFYVYFFLPCGDHLSLFFGIFTLISNNSD